MESRLLLAEATVALPANIEGNLASLCLAAQSEGMSRLSQTSALPFQIDALGRPMVSIWVRGELATVVAELGRMGAGVQATSPEHHLVEASVQIGDIPRIATMPHVLVVTPVYRPLCQIGKATTVGDTLLKADAVRNPARFPPLGFDGSGVKVGVLSDSVSQIGGGLADSVASGDLPAGVDVLMDYAGDYASDEGRALLEIIHDVAPGAKLAFHSAMHGELDFAQGIRDLAEAGARVIVDDVAYYTEPFFQDGIIAQAIDQVVSQYGVVYVTAAGNEQGQFHSAEFRDDGEAEPGSWHDFDPAERVDTHLRLTVPAGARAMITLQWSDPWYTTDGVTNNFDLYAFNEDGSVASSANTDNLSTQVPYETLIWGGHPMMPTTYNIAIKRVSGSGDVQLKLRSVIGDLQEYNDGESIVGHAAAGGAISVGAVPAHDPGVIEPTSSHGPATIYFDPQGNRLATPEVRHRPDVVAPDNVNTSFFGTDIREDDDDLPDFPGTSAAAPHVAALAALLLSARPDLSPQQVRLAIQKTSTDLGEAGWDGTYGAGLPDALAAATAVLSDPQFADTIGPDVFLVSPASSTPRPIQFADLRFNEAIDAATAVNAANYDLRGTGPDGLFDTSDDVIYAVVPSLDADARKVRLTWQTPSSTLPVGRYRLSVLPGIQDPAGNPLNDGAAEAFDFQRTLWGDPFVVGGSSPQVAVAPDGQALIAWGAAQATIFDANGTQVVAPFAVNSAFDLSVGSAAYDPTGHFMVGYRDRWTAFGYDAYLAKVDLSGRNEWITQVRPPWHLDVLAGMVVDAQGNSYVAVNEAVWPGEDAVWLRKFSPDGAPLTEMIRVDDPATAGNRRGVSLAADSTGNLVMTWVEGSAVIVARLFDSACQAITDPFTIAPGVSARVARNDSGFVVAWSNSNSDWMPGETFMRLYDTGGNPVSPSIAVTTPGLFPRSQISQVAFDPSGRINALFIGVERHLMLRRFDSAGQPLGTEFEVAFSDVSGQSGATLAVDGDGNTLVAWDGAARWLIDPLPPLPDLRAEGITVSQQITPGVTQQVTATFWDFGVRPASAQIRYTLSADASLGNADDRPLVSGDSKCSWAYGGVRMTDARDFTLPDDLVPGHYWIFAQADPANELAELDEANNVASAEVQVLPGPPALGDARLVNSSTAGNQDLPTIAMAGDGSYVIVWTGAGPDDETDIFARRYDPWGNPRGDQFRVNSTATGKQLRPSIAMSSDGAFVVVWIEDAGDESGCNVLGRLYDRAGEPISAELLLTDGSLAADQGPGVGMDDQGRFLAMWYGPGFVYGRQFDAAGRPLGPSRPLETSGGAAANVCPVRVVMTPDGRAIAIWGTGWSEAKVWAQRLDAQAMLVGDPILVSEGSVSVPMSIAIDASGDFAVARVGGNWQIGTRQDVLVQFFAADGVPRTDRLPVNTYLPSQQHYPTVAMDADGNAVVIWMSDWQGTAPQIVGRRFDSAGQSIGPEFYVTGFMAGSFPVVAISCDWHFAVAWQAPGDEDGTQGIVSRLFGVPPTADAELHVEAVRVATYTELGQAIQVTGSIRNVGGIAAGPFRIQYGLFARDYPYGAIVLPIGDPVEVIGLAAGEVWSDSRSIALPEMGITPDIYYLGLIADHDNAIAEQVEVDNTLVWPTPVTVADELMLTGTPGHDELIIRREGAKVMVWANSVITRRELASITRIIVDGQGGGDAIALQFFDGNPLPSGGLVFEPGDAMGVLSVHDTSRSDVLRISGNLLTIDDIPVQLGDASVVLGPAVFGVSEMADLTLSDSARVMLGGNGGVLRTSSLSISEDSVLDLSDNDLIVTNGDISAITGAIKSHRLIGKAVNYTGLVAVLNDKGDKDHTPIKTSFAGQSVLATDVLVKHSWDGDANLDGVVNADDYFQIDSGFISQKGGWYNGDFNYDDMINADDYFLIDSAFIGQSGPLAASGPAPAVSAEVAVQQKVRRTELDGIVNQLFSMQPILL